MGNAYEIMALLMGTADARSKLYMWDRDGDGSCI